MDEHDGTGNRQRLAAILAADAAGYSRLMAGDAEGTVQSLDQARQLFRGQIESRRGRVIDMAGDSVLAVFESAIGAVDAALGVQQQLEALAAGVPADRRMRFRIGVHLGEVIEKPDGTIYGDGVNIAARLEGLALPGSVTVSDAVHGVVRHRVAARFEDLGDQQVKNIADPVRAYRAFARSDGPSPAVPAAWPGVVMSLVRRRWVPASAALLAAGAIGVVWLVREVRPEGPARGATAPLTSSVAFGSIDAPANDGDAARLAEMLTQGLATGVSAYARHVRVVVTPRRTEPASSPREMARSAGARYIVEGNLQGSPARRFLDLRLIETAGGTQVWAGRSDLPDGADAEKTQIALREVVDRVAFAVGDAEVRRVMPKPVAQLDPMERVVRAYGLLSQGQSLAIAIEARQLLEEAERLEPTLLPVFWMMEWPLGMEFEHAPHPDRGRYVRAMDHYTTRSVALDPDNPVGWGERAVALLLLGRWNASLEASERAMKLDPYSSRSYNAHASLLISMGRPAEALPLIEKAAHIDGTFSGRTLLTACEAHLLLGAAEKAVATCERASGVLPNEFTVLSLLAAAQANIGQIREARAALEAMEKVLPGQTIAQLRAKRYSEHPEYQRLTETHWYGGLRKAGLPEQ